MAGRKPAVPPQNIKEEIVKHNIYNEDNKLKNRSDNVWSDICNNFENKIKTENLFKMVQQDRHKILTFYQQSKGLNILGDSIKEKENRDLKASYCDEDISGHLDNDSEDQECRSTKILASKNKKLKFEIVVPPAEWSKISPVDKEHKSGRTNRVLKDGWTDIIRKSIWNAKKLPCAYSFERHFIDSDSVYIKIEGHCTDSKCQAKINLVCQNFVSDDADAKFEVFTVDTKNIQHTKKVRLQKLAKEQVGEKLLKEKPKEWRRKEARKRMVDGDPEPADLYKLTQLQNARQDAKNEELGIKRGIKLFDSLSEIKRNVEFNKFVKVIGYDFFFLLYWSPEQTSIYNDILVKFQNAVSLDASSSISHKINRPGGDSSDIFISIMCTHIENQIVPITQALSEKNDTCFYVFWLQTWIQSGGKIPKELITDMGKAIPNGACLAFNNVTLKTYKDICLLILFEEPIFIDIPTQIRTDIAHLIHAVTRWPCYPATKPHVKLLFVKCVGYMSTINKLHVFEKVLKSVFIVAYSLHYNEICQKAMNFLIKMVQTYQVDLNNSTTIIPDEIILNNKNEKNKNSTKKSPKHTLVYTYIKSIQNEVLAKTKTNENVQIGIQPNDYCLPDFGNRLADLSKDFVCWTNVMQEFFKNPHEVAMSARSEACFGDLKADLEKTVLRVDKFLVKHCRKIDADMLLARAEINKLSITKNEKPEKLENEIECDTEHLMAIERWRKKCNKLFVYEQDDIVDENMDFTPLDLSLKSVNQNVNSSNEQQCPSTNKQIAEGNDSLEDHTYAKFESHVEKQSSLIVDEQIKDFIQPVTSCTLDPGKNNAELSSALAQKQLETPIVVAPKSRGIHVRPCPEIGLRLQQRHSRSSNARKKNIINGSKQLPRRMNSKRMSFSNTCAFDAITEILVNGCFKVVDLRVFIENSINARKSNQYLCYANAVHNYSTAGIASILYTNRAHILCALFKPQGSHVDCNSNISQMFRNLMMEYDSTLERMSCTNCDFKRDYKRIITFLPNLKIALVHSYKNLESELNRLFEDKVYECKKCNERSLLATYTIGPYLWIDTDEAYRESTYAKEELGIDTDNFVSYLHSVPQTIDIKSETYMLCGIVKYIPPFDKNGVGHYVAYCLTSTGWIEKNDLVAYSNILPMNTPPVKISSLLYAKTVHINPPQLQT